MKMRFSLSPESHQEDEAKYWAAFSDVALSMLLIFVLFILAQFLSYQKIFVLEEIERRKSEVAQRVQGFTEQLGGVEVEVLSEDDLHQRIRITGELVFEACRDDMRPTGRDLLRELGSILSTREEYFESVQVEGHADRQGATGIVCRLEGIEDNWQLSARRATEVVRLFSAAEFFPNAKLSSVGRGEFNSLSQPSDTTRAALRRDRRIEIVLLYSEEGILPLTPDV